MTELFLQGVASLVAIGVVGVVLNIWVKRLIDKAIF